jgi:Zn-dependent protease with chaperone function
MRKLGLFTNAVGLLVSVAGTLLLFLHTTNKYHAAIQDMESIALAYLGLVLLGVSISVTGVALLVSRNSD